jgi:pyruvate dehydrogenase E2 component (dihydrolipoamide acetyltransferase)
LPTDFTLPELGENVSTGDVLRVLVKPGDTIEKEQAVLELETDKATIEVPSSVAGKVKEIKVKEGDKVKVGQAILSVDDGGAEAAPASDKAAPAKEDKPAPAKEKEKENGRKAAPAKSEEPPKQQEPPQKQPARQAADEEPEPADDEAEGDENPDMQPDVEAKDKSTKPDKAGVKDQSVGPSAAAQDEQQPARPSSREQGRDQGRQGGAPPDDRKVVDINRGARAPAEPAAPARETPPAPAAPSVRRMARELGVDVNQVPGTGPGGRISVEDVKEHTKRLVSGAGGGATARSVPLPDFSRFGPVERQPMRAVRRKTAEHLSAAWATIPHVTQFDLADITGLEELRKKFAKPVEAAGGNLTVTAIALKVVASALRVFPQFNASIDTTSDEIVVKKYVHIGVAVDTDRGLLVPVIRDADKKNIVQLSVELAQLSEKARTRKISVDEMQGGCFSISNLGGIGGTYFTPIVNAPEVAILGISRARMEPVYQQEGGQFAPRLMLPLSLSYDHRVIDGADGIRFLRWVAEALEQPFLLALQG